ncbi:MAG: hypothetical protein A3J38_09220 [Gammaproteobacteria bacterium RIFCSPHIGHO2_12_FULL_45_9]|nr:MAG: hypothetical protein A3J38_09220 [Gammaproteobacteria bacterium RIFCSPHIGHO2_12_FULL_45_9]
MREQVARLRQYLPIGQLLRWGRRYAPDLDQPVALSLLLSSFFVSVLELALPLALLQLYERIIPNQATTTLWLLCIGIIVVLLIAFCLKVARSAIGAWLDARSSHRQENQNIAELLDTPWSTIAGTSSSEQLQRLFSLDTLTQVYVGKRMLLWVDVLFVILFLGILFYMVSFLALVPTFVLLLWLKLAWVEKKQGILTLKEKTQAETGRLQWIINVFACIPAVKILALESTMMRRNERIQHMTADAHWHGTSQQTFLQALQTLLMQGMFLLIIIVGGVMVMRQMLTVGAFSASILLASRCFQPLARLTTLFEKSPVSVADTSPLKTDTAMRAGAEEEASLWTAAISLDHLFFRYHEEGPYLFEDLTWRIEPGEWVGVQGRNGVGKTTLCNLLLGLLSPTAGEIRIGEQALATIPPATLRAQITYLPKQAALFHGTLLENITLFQPEHEARAKALARELGLTPLVEKLVHGYHTRVADPLMTLLPTGITQRIVLIRALLREPRFILFDEASVLLDGRGMAALRTYLKARVASTAVIIFSHDPNMLGLATRQFRLLGGKMVLIGERL